MHESELSEIQMRYIRELPLARLKKRISYHTKMIDIIKEPENQRTWVYSHHVKCLEYAQKVYAEYILTGNDE